MTHMHSALILQEPIRLAERRQDRANELLTAEEKGIQEQMVRLLTHPMDKVVLRCGDKHSLFWSRSYLPSDQ